MENKSKLVFEDMLSKILVGHYKVNEKLPTERELSQIYSVSRHIIRSSLNSLERINFIRRVQGSGNFVNPNPSPAFRYNSFLSKRRKDITSKILSFELRKANDDEKSLFNLHNDLMVWDFVRLRLVESIITRSEHTIMPHHLFPNLSKAVVENSIYEYINKEGYTIMKVITEFSPINLSKEDSEILYCKKGKAAMKIKNIGLLTNGRLFEITNSIDINYSCTFISDFNHDFENFRSNT